MLEPWEKLALITPNRAFEKKRRWKPNDDVKCRQKHVYFDPPKAKAGSTSKA